MAFVAEGPSGAQFTMDSYPESGGSNRGPTPVEALVSSLAACTGMDVISILHKKKQRVDSYRIEVEYERDDPGTWPRPIKKFVVKHIVEGEVDPDALKRAVELSDEKYCTVASTLRGVPEIESVWTVAEPAP